MNFSAEVFDQPHARSLAEAKKAFLDKILPEFIKNYELKTAIDVGCGFGYFTKYLADLGLNVTATDARPENISQASMRNPDSKFENHNIEDQSIIELGSFDITLALGVLYHLENPFLAIRNLGAITKNFCFIETMIAPFKIPIALLVDEPAGQDQGLNICAIMPSESCVVKMLYKAGFRAVYGVSMLPDHRDFRSSIWIKRKRTFLIASKFSIEHPLFLLIPEPKQSNPLVHFRFGLNSFLENEHIGKYVHGLVKIANRVAETFRLR